MFSDIFDDFDSHPPEPDKLLDVPFVPSDEIIVDTMLKLARVGPRDLIYDLGSGDGRILISAARERGARGIGIDLDPQRIADAMEEAGWARVEYLVDFIEGDIFDADLGAATVVMFYLLESVNLQLRPMLLEQLRPGTRIVSHAFNMGDWRADDWIEVNGINVYKWIVPAQVAGNWEWTCHEGKAYRIELQQEFQEVTGKAWLNGKEAELEGLSLTGDRLDLAIKGQEEAAYRDFALFFDDKGNLKSITVTE